MSTGSRDRCPGGGAEISDFGSKTQYQRRLVPATAESLCPCTSNKLVLCKRRAAQGRRTSLPGGLEPVGENVERAASTTSKSAVSRRFVAMTATRSITLPLASVWVSKSSPARGWHQPPSASTVIVRRRPPPQDGHSNRTPLTSHKPNDLRTPVDLGPQLGRALTASSFGDPVTNTWPPAVLRDDRAKCGR